MNNFDNKCNEIHAVYYLQTKFCVLSASVGVHGSGRLKMFKRPIQMQRATRPTHFVSEISRTTPGRVSEILETMRTGLDPKELAPQIWKPSIDYKFIAETMLPAQAAEYIRRSEEWFAIHTKNYERVHKDQLVINPAPVLAPFTKSWPHCPPVDEHVSALKEAGYPDSKIEKVIRWHKWRVDTSDSRQEALDAIFAKWPAASKPTPKTRKVIKVVKKKI